MCPEQDKQKTTSNKYAPRDSTQCPTCDKSFYSKSTLNRHIRNKPLSHSNVFPTFQCPICTNAFRRQDTMIRHITNSKDEKHQACLVDPITTICKCCKRNFKDRTQCNKHSAKCHPFSGFKMSPLSTINQEPSSFSTANPRAADKPSEEQTAHNDWLKTVSPWETTFNFDQDFFATQVRGEEDLGLGQITGLSNLWESAPWSENI